MLLRLTTSRITFAMTEPRRCSSQVERSGYNGNAIRVVRTNFVPSAASCPSLCYPASELPSTMDLWLFKSRNIPNDIAYPVEKIPRQMAGTAMIEIRYSGRESPSITEFKSAKKEPVTTINVSAIPAVPASRSVKVSEFCRSRCRVVQ